MIIWIALLSITTVVMTVAFVIAMSEKRFWLRHYNTVWIMYEDYKEKYFDLLDK